MMEMGLADAVAQCDELLGAALVATDLALVDDAGLLELERAVTRVQSRVAAAHAAVLAAVDARDASHHERGVSTSAWLQDTLAFSGPHAGAAVAAARRLVDLPIVWRALAAGEVSPRQAESIVDAIRHLPPDVEPGARARAEEFMVDQAGVLGPRELRSVGHHLVEVVAPDHADDLLAAQLERQEARAREGRELWFTSDGMGVMKIRGRLPLADGEHLAALVDAVAERRRCRGVDAPPAVRSDGTLAHDDRRTPSGDGRTPSAEDPTPSERAQRDAEPTDGDGVLAPTIARSRARLDALLEIAAAFADADLAPAMGGDRPRLTVTVPLSVLTEGVGAVEVAGGLLSATELRRVACDAEVIPAVLDARGVPLDVGAARRLFPDELRAALVARDGGCVFPGCEQPARRCQAHHIIPWWFRRWTALANGALLCQHHHALVEPARRRADGSPNDPTVPDPDRWAVRINPVDLLPEFLPPARLDPERRPRRHHRHQTRRRRTCDADNPDG